MPSPGFDKPEIGAWAEQLEGRLASELGLKVQHRILGAGESGAFARFQFKTGPEYGRQVEALIMDLAPGPITEFGRTFEMVYQGGGIPGEFSGAGFGPELIAMPGVEEVGVSTKPSPILSLRNPFEAMTEYINQVFTSETLKKRFPQDPQRRLGKLLYKGIEEGPVAGGLQQATMFHTGLSRDLQARSVAVAIHPDLRDQRAVHEAIYRFATQAAIADPSSPAAALQYYAPHKATGDIVRLHPQGLGFAGWGERGQYDPTYWGTSTEQIAAMEGGARDVKAAETMYKRQTITYGMMGVRERATLFGANAAGQLSAMEPEFITGAKSSAGWKWLNAIAPGQTERMAAYVRPGVVFTPGSPVSGAGFLYGPEGFPEGAAFATIPKEHRVALPPIGVPEVPTMGLEFGIFKRKEIAAVAAQPSLPADKLKSMLEVERTRQYKAGQSVRGVTDIIDVIKGGTPLTPQQQEQAYGALGLEQPTKGTAARVEYEKQAELKGYGLGVGESAIIGLMKYRAETGEEIIQEISFASGTSPTVFTGLPTLKLPPQYNIATGEGMAGFGETLAGPTAAFAAAAKEKFGIPVEARTQSKVFLDFPIAMGVAPSGKSFGVKSAWQQMEQSTGGWKQPTVDIAGKQALVTGMTGEIKDRINQFAGVFFGMTPEQQLGLAGEFGKASGATPEAKAMSEAMQRHIKTVNLKYFAGQGDPGAPHLDVLGQVYASYMGLPASPSNPYAMLNAMRGIIERPGYEAASVEKYGHALVGPAWYPVGIGGRDQWKLFRKSALEGAELLLLEQGLSMKTAEGRKAFRAMMPGGISDIVRWNREQGAPMEPFGEPGAEMGYLEYKSRGLYSTLTTYMVPEYMTKLPMMGAEEKMSLMIANPELAKELGIDAMMGPEGVAKTGYGFTPTHVSGWRQIGEVARAQLQRKERGGPMRPTSAIDVTPELQKELQAALSTMDPKKPDLAVLEKVITDRYGPGDQVLWNADVGRAFPRPLAIESTATSDFPGGTPYYDPLSILTKNYAPALSQFLGAETSLAKQGIRGFRPSGELKSFYTEIGSIFSSASKGVEKLLQGSFMAGSIGGRYNFQMGAGFNTVVMQTQAMNMMIKNMGHHAGLSGAELGEYMSIAQEQLRFFERIPGLLSREPRLDKAVNPVWATTTGVMRKLGIHYPEATSVSRGRVVPNSVFATGIAMSVGPLIAKMVGDWDLDQAQMTLLAKADPTAGLLLTQNEALYRQLGLPTKRQIGEMKETLTGAMGFKGLVAGGEMNVLAEAFSGVISKGQVRPRADPFEPILQAVPRANIWEAGTKTLGAVQGMGVEYNTRRMLEASASALGWSGKSIALGHTASGLRYQEYLDKLRGTLRDVTTLLGSASFEPHGSTGVAQIIAKMGDKGGWPALWEAGPQKEGHPMMGVMTDYLSLALQRDKSELGQSVTGDFAAFSMAMREQDIPRLRGWINQVGDVGAAVSGLYAPYLEEQGIRYDPTRTPLGLAFVGKAVEKATGWGGRPVRQAKDPMTLEPRPTMEIPAITAASFQFMGKRTTVGDLPQTSEMLAMKAGYGFLTRKYPVTMGEVGNLYGMAQDLGREGREVPVLWQLILGRYDAAAESQTVIDTAISQGTLPSATFLDPEPFRSTPIESRITYRKKGMMPFVVKWKGKGYQVGGSDVDLPGGYKFVHEGELIVPTNIGESVYPKNITAAIQAGALGVVGRPEMLGGALQNLPRSVPLAEAPYLRSVFEASALGAEQGFAEGAGVFQGMLSEASINFSRSYSSKMRQPALTTATQSFAARRMLLSTAPRYEGLMEDIYQLLPETGDTGPVRRGKSGQDLGGYRGRGKYMGSTWGLRDPSEMILDVMTHDPEGLQRLYEKDPEKFKTLSREFAKASAFQQVKAHPDVLAVYGEGEAAEQRGFLEEPTGTAEKAALYAGKTGAIVQTVAAAEKWSAGTTGGRRGTVLSRAMGEMPVESMKEFSVHVQRASKALKGLFETVEREGPESRAGAAAFRGITRELGGIKRRALGMALPAYAEAEAAAWAQYRADPTPATAAAAAQASEVGMAALAQYRTAGVQERGGLRAGTQASRFMRGLIGGWGLMYMGHLAQFPMQQAQFGFAETEQFQTQIAGYAGGQMGPGIEPFPSIQMQMQRAQLGYGGQGFGAMQAYQAGMAPLARDISGMALAGAAGGALSLYFGSVAGTALGAESALAGFFGAAAPYAAVAGAAAYGYLQYSAWKQQPQQTMAAALIGRKRGGGVPDLLSQSPQDERSLAQWYELGGAALRELSMTDEQRRQTEMIDVVMGGWERGEPGYTPSLIPLELQPIAAQRFAATMREGLDVDLGGQAFVRLGGMATPEQVEDVVWAQMRGVDTPKLAAGLLQAGRRVYTQEAAGALELQMKERVPDLYAAARLQSGAEIMGRLPVSMLEGMYGKNFDEIAVGEALEPWARSDLAGLLLQEGQLVTGAEASGLSRDPQKEWANAQILSRIKSGEATSQEIKQLSVSQAREQRAQTMANQAAYYSPNLKDAVYADAQRSPKQAELWQTAIAGLGQATALGISVEQFSTQMTGGTQQALLGQQAISMTRQYAMWGGQRTGEFFGMAAGDIGTQVFAQRIMKQDPMAFADLAMGYGGAEPYGPAAQFATTVDVGLSGQLTGLGWGTTSLARAGGPSGEIMAHKIWGDRWQGTEWGKAAVEGIRTPGGRTVAGQQGLQWYMRGLQYEQQQAGLGISAAQVALQEEYMPQFWDVQDRQRALGHEQRLWGFEMQQQQFAMQGTQFQEQRGLQRRGQLMQRGWAVQDWAYQDQMRTMQWGWKQEDFAEQVRFMTGRERKLAERGMERETIMYGMEGERIDVTRERQKESWALEDARFDMQKKHFEEQRELQEINMKKQREFYEEGKKLQDEMIKLQREYQLKQLELQKAAIGVQAEYAEKMKEAQDAMIELGEEQQTNAGYWKLAQSRQVEMINTIVDGMNWLIDHIPEAFQGMLEGNGHIPRFNPGSNGGMGTPGGEIPMATGGPILPFQVATVGEEGIEAIRSSVPRHVFPANETFAAMLGGTNILSDPWSQTVIGATGGDSTGESGGPSILIVNIGNERLGEFVLNTVNDALEVR